MDQKKLVDTLNDVIETLQDGVDGYRRAAEDAKSPELKTLFRAFCRPAGRLLRMRCRVWWPVSAQPPKPAVVWPPKSTVAGST
ncbi:MAG: DUF2383 domain-containing protein [Chloroflexaceae bacterium]|nr:DUF2383 domain-containing protein [Chloroflexaceae bacterium]